MKIAIISLLVIIIQEMSPKNNQHTYKVVTENGDTGIMYTNVKLEKGDTFNLK